MKISWLFFGVCVIECILLCSVLVANMKKLFKNAFKSQEAHTLIKRIAVLYCMSL